MWRICPNAAHVNLTLRWRFVFYILCLSQIYIPIYCFDFFFMWIWEQYTFVLVMLNVNQMSSDFSFSSCSISFRFLALSNTNTTLCANMKLFMYCLVMIRPRFAQLNFLNIYSAKWIVLEILNLPGGFLFPCFFVLCLHVILWYLCRLYIFFLIDQYIWTLSGQFWREFIVTHVSTVSNSFLLSTRATYTIFLGFRVLSIGCVVVFSKSCLFRGLIVV